MSWKINLQLCLLVAVFVILQSCSNLRPQFRYVNKVAANSEGFEQQAIAHKKAINLIQPKVLSCEAETAIPELEQHNTFSTEIANVQLIYESVPRTEKVFKPSFKVKNVLNAFDAKPSSTGKSSFYWLFLLPILFPAAAILGRQKKRSDEGCGGCILVILLVVLLLILVGLLL